MTAFGRVPTRRLVVGITGASGARYARQFVDALGAARSEGLTVSAVLSRTAAEVWALEIGGDIRGYLKHQDVPVFDGRDYRAPFASGSAGYDAMVILPCSMSTVAKVAHGLSDDLLTRAADVILKERRTLILVPRESPLSVIHLENLLTCARAGALILPAMPSFYGGQESIAELVHTIVARVLDHLGLQTNVTKRWGDT